MKRNTWIGLTAGIVVVGSATTYFIRDSKEEVKWRIAKVDRGSITQRISATGTLSALIQVPVGTQVSGVVTGLYADFNSLVKKGQVIARIDSTIWETQLKDAQAALQRAEAAYENAKIDYARNKRLYEQKLIADSDLDAKDLALKTAAGNLDSAKAGVQRAKLNLDYCTITAPVNGVVVARLVDEGQTVAASFSTPNLFTIAQDLAKLKVQVAIDESDIGQVKVGQEAFFTVDSYPDKQFRGVVSEVQLNPVITQNVVTYNVVMEVNNKPRNAPEGQGGDSNASASRGASGKDGSAAPDPEALWQRVKEHLPPGTTKEAFLKHVREKQSQAAQPKADQSQQAGLELATARYIPAGSPVYKGDLALFPGMTANCTIITNRKQDTMRLPSVALRFNPAAFVKDLDKAAPAQAGAARPASGSTGGSGTSRGLVAERKDRVWILENGKPKAIPVKAGITDGQFTEVSGELVQEGLEVLTGVQDLKKAQNGQSPSPLGGGPGGMPRR